MKFHPRMPEKFHVGLLTSQTSSTYRKWGCFEGSIRPISEKETIHAETLAPGARKYGKLNKFPCTLESIIKAPFYTKICSLGIVFGSNQHSMRKGGRKLRTGEQNEQHFLLSLFSGRSFGIFSANFPEVNLLIA